MNYKDLIYREIEAINKIPTEQVEKLVGILLIRNNFLN